MNRSAGGSARMSAGGDAALKLGVKGKLSNQEMEQLKQQLAQAVAYDHVPDRDRKIKPTPMTRVYRKLEPETLPRHRPFRPSIKPQATIEYEKRFTEGAYDALRMRPAPRGITQAAKTVLQDEYVTRPREISVIPKNKHMEGEEGAAPTAEASKQGLVIGKRHAPAAIAQVFIL